MKHNSTIINFAISFFAIASILATSLTEAASVRSLSRETRIEVDGKTLIEVSVTCSGFSIPRVISRASGVNKWCAKNDPTACDSGKIRAARKVCSSRRTTIADNEKTKTPDPKPEEVPAAKSAAKKSSPEKPEVKASADKAPATKTAKLDANGKTRSELMKEYIQIEEQRILVEQQRLELNKRELEIQRRELAL